MLKNGASSCVMFFHAFISLIPHAAILTQISRVKLLGMDTRSCGEPDFASH